MALTAAMADKDSLEVDGDPFKIIGEKVIEGREIRLQLSANVPTAETGGQGTPRRRHDQLDSFREMGLATPWPRAVLRTGAPSSPNRFVAGRLASPDNGFHRRPDRSATVYLEFPDDSIKAGLCGLAIAVLSNDSRRTALLTGWRVRCCGATTASAG